MIDDWGQGQVVTGTDTVQIIHPDGTNRMIVSEPITSTINRAINGTTIMCYMTSGIRIPPVWSPDGRYLVFGQNFWPVGDNKIYYSYYLNDVETGDTRMITTQRQYSNPVWLSESDQFVFEGDNGRVAIATILSNGQVEIDYISFPPSVPASSYVSFSYDRFDNLLVGNFRIENTEDPSSHPIVQLWTLDISDGTWAWKYSFDLNVREAVQFGRQYAVFCDTQREINLLDINTGNILDLDIEPLGIEVDCATLQLIIMDSNLEAVTFYGSADHGEGGIWIGALQSNDLEFRLIINDELITTLDERHLDILEFSFGP